MLITILSIIVAAIAIIYPAIPPPSPIPYSNILLAFLMIPAGTVVLLVQSLYFISILIPLQRLELRLVPDLVKLFQRDKSLRLFHLLLFLFTLLCYALAALSVVTDWPHKEQIIFAIWIIAFGATLDLIRYCYRRMTHYLTPSFAVDIFQNEAVKAIQNDQDKELWGSFDSLFEIIAKGIEENKLALITQTLDTFPPIFQTFFSSAKSISRRNKDQAVKEETGLDEASYTLYYFLQRIELIGDQAIRNRLESVCNHIIVVLGKIIVSCAKFDLSMVGFPAHVLGKITVKAQQNNFDRAPVLATSTLLEISKTILSSIDLTYSELQEPFGSIINDLRIIAQETFKKDKTVNLKVLTQPLLDLKTLIQTEKMAQHPDTPVLIVQIDQVLAEFDALEQVLRTIPSFPSPSV